MQNGPPRVPAAKRQKMEAQMTDQVDIFVVSEGLAEISELHMDGASLCENSAATMCPVVIVRVSAATNDEKQGYVIVRYDANRRDCLCI